MDDWQPITTEDESVPGWEAWSVEVRLGTMPDGTVAAIGLRIEPRDDYDGSIRDQKITLDRLRQFPIGFALAQARYAAARAAQTERAEPSVGSDEDAEDPTLEEILAFLQAGGRLEGPKEDWERVALLGEAIAARFDAWEANRASANAEWRADLEAQVRQLYRDGGWTEREIDLQRASDHYRDALRDPTCVSPRRFVAESLGVSLTTVDRLLRAARADGYLAPYDGPQGKHGKPKSDPKSDRR